MKSGALIAALGLLTAISPAQSWMAWSKYSDSQPGNLGFPHFSYAPDGSLYCGASTGSSVSYPNGNYLMRFDSAGNLLWKIQGYGVISPGNQGGLDSQNNIVSVAATATGVYSANISSRDLPAGNQLVVNRYDQNGTRIWARFADPFPQANYSATCSVVADSQNNVYALSEFENQDHSGTITYKGRLYKFLADGTAAWAKDVGTTLGMTQKDLRMKIDHSGNVVIFSGSYFAVRFAKYAPDGTLLFKKIGSTPAESASHTFDGIQIGQDDSIYLPIVWNQGGVLKTNVEKYTSAGILAWSTQIPNESDWPYTTVDPQSNVYVGTFNGPRHSDLSKISPTGVLQWTKPTGMDAEGIGSDVSGGIHVFQNAGTQDQNEVIYKKFDGQGNELLAKTAGTIFPDGLTHSIRSIGNRLLATADSAQNTFVLQQLDTAATVTWNTSVTRTTGDAFTVGAATDPSGNTYMLGGFNGSVPRLNIFSPSGALVTFKPLDCKLWMTGRYDAPDEYTIDSKLGQFSMNPVLYMNGSVYVNLDGGSPYNLPSISRIERLDLSGNKMWEFQTPGDPARAFASDGTYVYSGGNYIFKISQGGGLVWRTQLPNQVVNQVSQPSIADKMVVDSNHNVYVSSRRMIYRLTSAGAVQWSYKTPISTKVDIFHDLKIAPDDNLVAAETTYPVTMEPVGQVVKVSQAGATLWTAKPSIPGASQLSIHKLIVDASGNTFALGAVRINTKFSAMLHKISPSGQILWSKTLDFGSQTTPVDIKIGAAGRLIIGCNTMGNNSIDYVLARLDTNGLIQHTDIYNGPYNLMDYELGFNLDSVGNSYVYGWSVGGGGTIDYHAVKYMTSNP